MYQVGTNKGITLHEITTTRCVIAQKSAVLVYFVAEA